MGSLLMLPGVFLEPGVRKFGTSSVLLVTFTNCCDSVSCWTPMKSRLIYTNVSIRASRLLSCKRKANRVVIGSQIAAPIKFNADHAQDICLAFTP